MGSSAILIVLLSLLITLISVCGIVGRAVLTTLTELVKTLISARRDRDRDDSSPDLHGG
jgi:hypothetical protein